MEDTEKAIIKTLIYSDIFDYPLTREEIWIYLIEEKVTLDKMTSSLKDLVSAKRIFQKGDYYFLPSREPIVDLRKKRAKFSRIKIEKAQKWLQLLKLNPWLKMIVITGALAVESADIDDDIDLMLVFSSNRLFSGRLVEFILLKLLRKRRNPEQKEVSDIFCPNLYLTTDSLKIKNEDLFTAHEIVQVRIVWDRGGVYDQFLNENIWVENYLPNWRKQKINKAIKHFDYTQCKQESKKIKKQRNKETKNQEVKEAKKRRGFILFDWLEKLAKRLQIIYMGRKVSVEKISGDSLFFHPNDVRGKILATYGKKLKEFGLEDKS